MKKFISKLHYLTQDLPNRTHIEQAQTACEAGANWIQYRCFSKPDAELVKDLEQIGAICDDWGATLIVTDHYHLINLADIQGVHIEDMNANWTQIKNTIGEERTLGASANSFDDIQKIFNTHSVDYIGCGPFGHTDTKPNNYLHLGVDGYKSIMQNVSDNGINIPILAVGGVTIEAVDSLLTTGIFGIAVSGAINHSDNPEEAYKDFHRKLF